MLPQVAARQLYQEEAGGPVAAALIKAIGVYPPGDFVRLNNGDAAVVVRHASVGQPILVASIIGANGKPVPGAPRRDTSQPEFTITGPLLERKVMPRILGEQIYGLVEG